MSSNEFSLFLAFVKKSERYLEFGAGGSTSVASSQVKSWVISIDSSKEWLEKVRGECSENSVKPDLNFVDLGPTGDWGYPVDPSARKRWPRYHSDIWNVEKSAKADLCFVDGRFRVACFAQIVLHCLPDTIIGFHDFSSRAQYRRVNEIAREIAAAEDISFFQPLPDATERAIEILETYRFNPT